LREMFQMQHATPICKQKGRWAALKEEAFSLRKEKKRFRTGSLNPRGVSSGLRSSSGTANPPMAPTTDNSAGRNIIDDIHAQWMMGFGEFSLSFPQACLLSG